MSDCPAWRPDCWVSTAVDTAGDSVDLARDAIGALQGVGRFVRGAGDVAGAIWSGFGQLAEPVGGRGMAIIGLLVVVWLWAIWRFVSGAAGKVKVAAPAAVRAYTGVDLSRSSSEGAGVAVGSRLRALSDRRSGRPMVAQVHTGQGVEIVDEQNDSTGRLSRLVVCAATPAEAVAVAQRRRGGVQWRSGGSKPCDLAKSHRHFTLTRPNNSKGGRR